MNYVHWWWHTLMLDVCTGTYMPAASAMCKMILPCHSYWQENYLGPASNDNSRV